MKRWIHHAPTLLGIVSFAALITFLLWYRGSQHPLSDEEQSHYLGEVEKLPASTGGFIDLESTREFLQSDDGRPFYVVNVFKFRDEARYADAGSNVSGYEAFQRFTRQVVPLWIKRGSHPVFATTLSARFSNDWDLVSIVRYRSRRDFIAIQTSDEFVAALPDRLAATEANIRLKLPGIHLPPPSLALILFWTVLMLIGLVARRIFSVRR